MLSKLAYLTLCRSIQLLALLAAVSRVLPRARWSCCFVQPETLLGWHRRWSPARGPTRTARAAGDRWAWCMRPAAWPTAGRVQALLFENR